MPRRRLGLLVLVALALALAAIGCSNGPDIEVIRDVTVPSGRGGDLHADVYATRSPGATTATDPALRPVVIMIHGGAWTRGTKTDLASLAKKFAASGFVAVSIEYDLSAPDRFPHQVQDSQSWVRYVQQHAAELGVDAGRVGVFG
ncbi:MAG TPA: alpha/beta hydrolase, partial [Acidimicrobiales bacterium]